MSFRFAINGFGRIGRCVARIAATRADAELVAINGRAPAALAAHLLQYDSSHGVFALPVAANAAGDELQIGDSRAAYTQHARPQDSPWRALAVNVVMECTGKFNDAEQAGEHLQAGAGRVLASAPCKGADATVVYGVNHSQIGAQTRVVSNASCTTNCLAPVAKTLHDAFGLECGTLNTVHAYTLDQNILDKSHTDYRRARAAGVSLVPTKTGAATAIGEVLPALAGRLSGLAVRAPVANVSLIDFTCVLQNKATAGDINAAFAAAAAGKLAGVLAVCELPLVSCDFAGRSESAIVDLPQTQVTGGKLAKVLAWYDNEWGFACRMLDTAAALAAAA